MEGPRRHRRDARVRETPPARYAPAATPPALAGVLLDTDVLIEVLRGRRRIAEAILGLEAAGVRTYACAVSWAEIHAGLRPGEEALTQAFLTQRAEVVIDAHTGQQAGQYLARYARSHGLEIADALIAAAATTSGLALWTQNRRDYPMADLRFYSPT
ncbi:MAG: PIN domain-containing protein [Candidatus Rokuibacteriota bacterium]